MLRRGPPLVFVVLTLAATATSARTSLAQSIPSTDEFSTARFSPAPGGSNYLAVDGAYVAGHLAPTAGFTFDYAHRPFTLYEAECAPDDPSACDITGEEAFIVRYAATGYFYGTLTLWDRLQLGAVLPLLYTRGDEFSYTPISATEPVELHGGRSFAVGDVRLSAKASLTPDADSAIGVAASVFVTAPAAQATAEGRFAGEGGFTGGGQVIGEWFQRGVHVAANVGGNYRRPATLFSTRVGSQLTYGLAFGYDLTSLVTVFGEISGLSSFSSQVDENPAEGRVAGRLRFGDLAVTAGVGGGLVSGVGIPVFRLVGSIAWAPFRGDGDWDGVADENDQCPTAAEDRDGYLDADGCPESDNDNDGLPDTDDRCPDDPEDRDEFQDEDGCPDNDNDGDGVLDGYDSCPMEQEDPDGDRDEDGCPDDDTDRDGVDDAHDACPTVPEDTDGFGDEDGCPEMDFDDDGIPDDGDECPDQAETYNGLEDEDGCPEPDGDGDGVPDDADRCPNQAETINGIDDDDGCADQEATVVVENERIMFVYVPAFTAAGELNALRSRRMVDAALYVMRRFPRFSRVRVEVRHADAGVADRQARAIVAYLISSGVAEDHLTSIGSAGEPAVIFNAVPPGPPVPPPAPPEPAPEQVPTQEAPPPEGAPATGDVPPGTGV